MTLLFRSPYNYDRDAASLEAGLWCNDGSRAQQQFRDECDINQILKRFGVTGSVGAPLVMPTYGDFCEVGDFKDAMDLVRAAAESFMTLPAAVRDRFSNDPGRLLDFLATATPDQAREAGILPPKAAPAAVPVAAAVAAASGSPPVAAAVAAASGSPVAGAS